MEASGAVANIEAIIQLTAKLSQLSYSYVREAKNAPKIQKQYLQEVSVLVATLFRLQQAILDAESTGLLPPRPATLDNEALMDCYKQISHLHFQLQRRKFRLLKPFQDNELRQYIDIVIRLREMFSEHHSACTLAISNAAYQNVNSNSTEQVRKMLVALVPPAEVPSRPKPTACPGTGAWLFNHDTMNDWIAMSSQLLWCYGPPGVGKSYLASIVIDYLVKHNTVGALVVFFFCDYSAQTDQTAIEILRSAIRQAVKRGSHKTLSVLKEDLEKLNDPQDVVNLIQLLAKAGSVQPIYFVLDGIDEMKCPNELLDCCLGLAKFGIQVLVTSRKLPFIQKKMATASQLEISGDEKDLKLYIEKRLQHSDLADELVGDQATVESILSRCGNLFLLARLLLDELLDLTTISQIRTALMKKPFGLQEAFESTLQRIDGQSKTRSFLARRLISWVLYAKRRLKMEEVLAAFAVDEEGPNKIVPAPNLLLRVCLGMVVVNAADDKLCLVHTSAYEHFYSLLPPEEAHFDIGQTCLRYLGLRDLMRMPCKASQDLKARFDELKFLDYSAKHWGHHICNSNLEQRLSPLIMKLLGDEKLLANAFQALHYSPDIEGSVADEIFNSLATGQNALHLAAYWNLVGIVGDLLEKGADASATDSHQWTPLHWACSKNQFNIADTLVKKGANVDAPDVQGWTPLFWAAFFGNLDLVCLLLRNGASHHARSSLGWTALHWAISVGHFLVVKELLGHHACVKKKVLLFHKMPMRQVKGYFQETLSPIVLAAGTGNPDLFNILVQSLEARNGELSAAEFNSIWKSANFDVPVSKNPWRALTVSEVVTGMEPEVLTSDSHWDKYRSSPGRCKSFLLLSAIRDEQLAATRMLIAIGADFDGVYALHYAAHRRDPRYAQYLLQSGANVNLINTHGRTALHIALLNDFVETMTVLVQGGSDVNQPQLGPSGFFQDQAHEKPIENIPPLMLAGRNLHMVKILLSNGADPKLTDSSGRNALHYAFSRGDLPLIELLIQRCASVDILGPSDMTPLHHLTDCYDTEFEADYLAKMICYLMFTGYMLSPRRDFLNETTGHLPLLGSWPGSDITYSPISLSLIKKRWKLALIFSKLGASFPNNLDLMPIIRSAAHDFEFDVLDLLFRKGGRSTADLILSSVHAFTIKASRGPSWLLEAQKPFLYDKFKKCLGLLCSLGFDINFYGVLSASSKMRTTPLNLAAKLHESRDLLELLLDQGADLYQRSQETFDPILTTAIYGDEHDLSFLLARAIASPNPYHWTTFLKEVPEERDSIHRVCFCLRKAGYLDRLNIEEKTLLDLAVKERNVALVNALKAEKTREGVASNDDSTRVLSPFVDHVVDNYLPAAVVEDAQAMFIAVQNNDISAVANMLQEGSDPNESVNESRNSMPMLFCAAMCGRRDIVSLLLRHGARIETADSHGWRPLHVACLKGHADVVKCLIEKGADVQASTATWYSSADTSSGLHMGSPWTGTSLHLATMGGHLDIARLLLEHNIDIYAGTCVTSDNLAFPANGPTALHIALSVNRVCINKIARKLPNPKTLQIAQWLVEAGAMVQGVIQRLSLEDIQCFEEFPQLWDALVAGDA